MANKDKRQRGESMAEYQQRMYRQAEEDDRKASELAARRESCPHYSCHPVEWYWSGKPREMRCSDCGETKFMEDEDEL